VAITAKTIAATVSDYGLPPLPDPALEQLASYAELLQRWNARLNLTSIRTDEGVLHRHLMEGIFAASLIPPLAEPLEILDFGSGTGVPGIPIAICRLGARVTLAESQGKKAAFLREASRRLGLKGSIYGRRISGLVQAEGFDWVTMRAVDRMEEMLSLAVVQLRPKGSLMLLISAMQEDQLRAAVPLAGFSWERHELAGRTQLLVLTGRRVLTASPTGDVPRGTEV
jgi:16S rRNA (guanine527-N7)-methyltransferase